MAMTDDDPTIEASFEIIANAGGAKSLYLQAVGSAKAGEFDAAEDFVRQADEAFQVAHDVHLRMLQGTARGEGPEVSLILLHSEDQMTGAELVRVMAQELIDVYKRMVS